jgi:two-component sensor histidine kinase
MRYYITFFLLFVSTSALPQTDFIFNGRNVNVDSVFFKRSNALYHYDQNIDSAIFETKANVSRVTLIYIKAIKLFSDNKWKESNQLLKFCLAHTDSLNELAKLKIEIYYGYNLVLLGNVPQGMKYMSRVDSTAENYGNATLILNIKNFYAEANRSIGRLDRAQEILESGIKYFDEANWTAQLGFTLSMVTTLNQLAVDKKDPSLAARANSITDPILDDPRLRNVDQMLFGSMLAEKGASLSILKQHTEAIAFFVRAQEIFGPVFPAGAFNQEINIFHEYYNLKEYKVLIKLGEEILPKFDQFKELNGRKIEIYQRLSDAYEETGNYKQALHYTHLLIIEKETADQIRYSKDLADLDEKYQNSKIEEEVRIANIEKKISDKNALEQADLLRYAIVACIIFATLLVIAIVLAFQFNLAKKRIVQQAKDLENKNLELDKAMREKDFLFKELHHRVKNNIQLIISFMKLQYKYSASGNIENFIQDIESKMNAMALVHEKLYIGNTHESIDLKDYLEDISGYILDSLANIENVPDVNISGESVRIHIDAAIPVGLIVNEVITNSIKHSGNEHDEPEINLNLRLNDGMLVLQIGDNGKGFPAGFDPEKTNSLGTKAILLLAKQIHANISWKNNKGAQWELSIPLNKL